MGAAIRRGETCVVGGIAAAEVPVSSSLTALTKVAMLHRLP